MSFLGLMPIKICGAIYIGGVSISKEVKIGHLKICVSIN
jgi:hypothetical protein